MPLSQPTAPIVVITCVAQLCAVPDCTERMGGPGPLWWVEGVGRLPAYLFVLGWFSPVGAGGGATEDGVAGASAGGFGEGCAGAVAG
jgi:hypothetical protein